MYRTYLMVTTFHSVASRDGRFAHAYYVRFASNGQSFPITFSLFHRLIPAIIGSGKNIKILLKKVKNFSFRTSQNHIFGEIEKVDNFCSLIR
jgi:hypothetical protein